MSARHVFGKDSICWVGAYGLGQYWAHVDIWRVDGGMVGEVTAWRRKNDDYTKAEMDTFAVTGEWQEGTDEGALRRAHASACLIAYETGVLL